MSSRVPASKPKISQADVRKIIDHFKIDRNDFPVCVVAIRGYYLNSMGQPGVNDRGIFDDAAAVDTPDVFVTVNWNTDASAYRKGHGTGAEKGMAMLAEGVWDYQIGAHKGRSPAGVQAGKVTVMRDSDKGGSYADTGYFGINLHWGSASGGTSSLGCQTAPPDQFPSFINPIVAELKRYGKKVFKYILISEAMRQEILSPTAGTVAESPQDQTAPAPAPAPAVISIDAAISIIKEFEGLYLNAYRDPVGIWTIGWGTIQYPDGRKVAGGDKITVDQANQYLNFEVIQGCTGQVGTDDAEEP